MLRAKGDLVVISVRGLHKSRHFRVAVTDGGKLQVQDLQEAKKFETIAQLIEHHRTSPLGRVLLTAVLPFGTDA